MAQANVELVISAKDQASGVVKGFSDAISSSVLAITAAVTAATTAVVVTGIKTAASLETTEQGFVGLGLTTEEAGAALEQIKKDAAQTPFEFVGLAQANQLLTSVTKDAGRSEDFLLNIGKSLTAMGRGQPELDRVIVNLQQIGAVGKASMIDIKQFAFAGIPIFDMLKEHTGLAGDELDKFISDGGVTFEMLEDMFAEAGEGAGRFAEAFTTQSGTFNQLLSNLKDNFGLFAADFVTTTGIFEFAKDVISGLVTLFGRLTPLIATVFEQIKTTLKPVIDEIMKAFSDAWPKIQEGFAALGDVIGTNTDAQKNFKDGISNFIRLAVEGIKSVITAFVNVATWIKNNKAFVSELITAISVGFKIAVTVVGGIIAVLGKVFEIFSKIWTTVNNVIVAVKNFVKELGKVSDKINPLKTIFGIKGGASGGIVMPKFAGGGIVPGVSIAGDQNIARVNSGEAILPQDKFNKLMSLIESGGLGGGNVNFNVSIPLYMGDQASKRTVAEEIFKEVERIAIAKGVSLNKLSLLGT